MVKVGDVIEVAGRKIGDTPRRGRVSGGSGALLRVRWDSGDETTIIPGPGTLTVVGFSRAGAAKKTATAKKASKPTSRSRNAAKAVSKKAAGTSRAAKRTTAKKAASSSAKKTKTKKAASSSTKKTKTKKAKGRGR